MKPQKLQILAILSALVAAPAFARPIEYSELSLLVRSHESDSFITDTAAQRKLLHPLTVQQENALRAQGASDSLIRSLHRSDIVLSQSEAAAFDSSRSVAAAPAPRITGADRVHANIQIVDVGVDQSLNLSAWAGPDMEMVFRAADIVETGRSEAELIDPISSYVHYATYRGYRVPNWEPVDPEYTSIVAHTITRPVHIDWRNPIQMNDVPYLLYPVYCFRGASIYFVGRMSDDVVRLAVITR